MAPFVWSLLVLLSICDTTLSQIHQIQPIEPVNPTCTSWKDRDNPSGKCDCEGIYHSNPARLKEVRDLLKTCKSDEYVIQAKLVSGTNIYENTEDALADTGNTINFNYKSISDPDSEFAKAGIMCWNKGQRCKDFAVRFCCGESSGGPTTVPTTGPCDPNGKRENCPMKPDPISIISREACLERKCCWDDSIEDKNLWCYQNPKPQSSCACVNCRFTVDNRVDYVKYNGDVLPITGGSNWFQEKVFSFQSCSDVSPGELEIRGTNLESSNHCYWAGLLLHCTANSTTSPWHNFVSDNTHWTVSSEGGAVPCQQMSRFAKYFEPFCLPTGTCPAANSYHFISSLNTAGAKKIWGQQQTVVLKGSP